MSFWSALVLAIGFVLGMEELGSRLKSGIIEAAKIKSGKSEDKNSAG